MTHPMTRIAQHNPTRGHIDGALRLAEASPGERVPLLVRPHAGRAGVRPGRAPVPTDPSRGMGCLGEGDGVRPRDREGRGGRARPQCWARSQSRSRGRGPAGKTPYRGLPGCRRVPIMWAWQRSVALTVFYSAPGDRCATGQKVSIVGVFGVLETLTSQPIPLWYGAERHDQRTAACQWHTAHQDRRGRSAGGPCDCRIEGSQLEDRMIIRPQTTAVVVTATALAGLSPTPTYDVCASGQKQTIGPAESGPVVTVENIVPDDLAEGSVEDHNAWIIGSLSDEPEDVVDKSTLTRVDWVPGEGLVYRS